MKTKSLLPNYIHTFFSGTILQFAFTQVRLKRLFALFVSALFFVNGFGQIAYQKDSKSGSGKAFLVQTSWGNPRFSISQNDNATSRKQTLRVASERPKLSVQLLLNEKPGSENSADALVAIFDEDFNAKIGDEDSYKFTNRDENIAIDRNGIALSIEGRPIINGSDTIPLRMWRLKQSAYLLKLTGINFAPDVSAYVKDEFLHVEIPINLTGETLLPFSLTSDATSSAPNRFTVLFKESRALPVVVTDVKASPKDRTVQVEWTSHTETNIDRYEIERSEDAQHFVKQGVVSAKANNLGIRLYDWFDQWPLTGTNFYRIKVIEKSGEVKYTEIAQVDIKKSSASVTVFPNPVTGNTFSINLKNMEKGRYSIMLYNNVGQSVFSTIINHDAGNAAHPVTTKGISKGIYQLLISSDNISKTAQVIFN